MILLLLENSLWWLKFLLDQSGAYLPLTSQNIIWLTLKRRKMVFLTFSPPKHFLVMKYYAFTIYSFWCHSQLKKPPNLILEAVLPHTLMWSLLFQLHWWLHKCSLLQFFQTWCSHNYLFRKPGINFISVFYKKQLSLGSCWRLQ